MKSLFTTIVSLFVALSASATDCLTTAVPATTNLKYRKLSILNNAQKHVTHRAAMAKSAVYDEAITEQPEGSLYSNWSQYAEGFSELWGTINKGITDGSTRNIVVADDGSVYIKDPISNLVADSWLKGSKAVGDTVVFNLPQKLCIGETDGDNPETIDCLAYRMVPQTVTVDGALSTTYVLDTKTQTMKFVLRNDTLRMVGDGTTILGLATATDGEWLGYGDYVNAISRVKDPLCMPAHPDEAKAYMLRYEQTADNFAFKSVKVAFEDNDVYVGGLSSQLPDAWLKGRIADNKVVFDGTSYLGVDESLNAHLYFSPAGIETVYYDFGDGDPIAMDSLFLEKQLVLDYDAAQKTIAGNGVMLINIGKAVLNNNEYFSNVSLAPLSDKPGVPTTPVIENFYPYEAEYNWGAVEATMPNCDMDGNYLNPDKLFYCLYLDNNKFTFTTDEYPEFESDVVYVPYTYDGTDIVQWGDIRAIYFHRNDFERLGVQAVYIDSDDKHYESPIAWVNADGTTAIDSATTGDAATVVKTQYTDLLGRGVSRPTRGIYVKTEMLSDGSVRHSKVVVRR